jgi:hypothetical protein
MVKWGKTNSDDLYCGCGEVQDMGHLLSCRDCPKKCTLQDLWLANKKGVDVAQYWAKKSLIQWSGHDKERKKPCLSFVLLILWW